MKRSLLLALPAFIAFGATTTVPAAADNDTKVFRTVEGVWSGPGEIVAGKYKGTKFTCKLNGTTPAGKAGMTLDGSCRVGIFSQRIAATVEKSGRNYRGKFLDGAAGDGLDIMSGSVDGKKMTFSISRKQLNGAMMARLPNRNTMNVSVSVRVDQQMVRVIAMDLTRVGEAPVATVASD